MMYLSGDLPANLVAELKSAIESAPKILFTNDVADGALAAPVDGPGIALLNEHHAYRDLDEPTKNALRLVFAHVQFVAAGFLRSPWRVLTCRSWTTKGGAKMGPNNWHKDGDLPNVLKMMVYGTPTGGEYGGLEWEGGRLSGQSWFLFYNSLLSHRGIAPSKKGIERVATEVTLCASEDFQLEPVFLGLAARRPIKL